MERMERIDYRPPYAIKNQLKARNAPVGVFGRLELVLYDIRVLAEQFLESNFDVE